ncbi:MAG TPA: YfhO family protein [Pyrinomonadaceae bacterium]|nr:YfhO family protein [Pyrinomonadaceae bacterium]
MTTIDNRLSRESLRHALFVAAGYLSFFLLFFAPVVFSRHVLAPGDGISYFLPHFYSRTLFWDASIWSGFPAVGDAPRMFWYPPALILSLIPRAWDLFIISAYVLAASFTYGYIFSVTRSRLAATISGLTYGLCGFMIAHIGHAAVVHTVAWLPLIVWSYWELSKSGRISRFWFATGTVGVACAALAGHAQMFGYVVLLSAFFALVQQPGEQITRLRYYVTCGSTLVVGIGLAAIQIAPTIELMPHTLRANLTFEEFVAYQLPLRQLPMLLFPFLYGGSPASFYATPYFGGWPSSADGWGASELTGYVGLLPLVLASIGFVVNRQKLLVWFWVGIAALAVLLAIGESTPLAWLTYHLPVLNKFRAPARHFFAFGFAVSVLAGFGVASISKGFVTRRLLWRTSAIAFGILIACLLALQLLAGKINELAIQRLEHAITLNPFRNPSLFVPVLLFLGGVASLIVWRRLRISKLRIVLVLLFLLLDLSSFAWFYEWRYRSPYTAYLQPPKAFTSYRSQLDETHQRVLPVRGGLGRVSELPPDLSKLWAIPSATGYGPFVLTRLNQLLSMPPHGSVDDTWQEPANQSLDLLAVRYVLLPESETDLPTQTDERGLRWSTRDFSSTIGPGCAPTNPLSTDVELEQPRRATRLGIVGTLGCSVELANGSEFAQVSVTNTAGQSEAISLRAGQHFSEWAWDCSDVKPSMKHDRAVVFSSRQVERGPIRCDAHDYVALLPLTGAQEIKKISVKWTGPPATFALRKMTTIDDERRVSQPVAPSRSTVQDTARWRLVAKIDQSNGGYGAEVKSEDVGSSLVYENTRVRPRAWLVSEVMQVNEQDALAAMRTSKLSDGRTVDLSRVALVEETVPVVASASSDNKGTARVKSLTNDVMEVEVSSPAAAFLVTSDTYYPGWNASIEGQETLIYRTNFLLRGVAVPAGNHLVRFEFRPPGFYRGALLSVLSLVLLIGLCVRSPR